MISKLNEFPGQSARILTIPHGLSKNGLYSEFVSNRGKQKNVEAGLGLVSISDSFPMQDLVSLISPLNLSPSGTCYNKKVYFKWGRNN